MPNFKLIDAKNNHFYDCTLTFDSDFETNDNNFCNELRENENTYDLLLEEIFETKKIITVTIAFDRQIDISVFNQNKKDTALNLLSELGGFLPESQFLHMNFDRATQVDLFKHGLLRYCTDLTLQKRSILHTTNAENQIVVLSMNATADKLNLRDTSNDLLQGKQRDAKLTELFGEKHDISLDELFALRSAQINGITV